MENKLIKDMAEAIVELDKDVHNIYNIDALLFTNRENVKQFAGVIANKLNDHFAAIQATASSEELNEYAQSINVFKETFKNTVREKTFEAHKIYPREASIAQIQREIEDMSNVKNI